MSLAATLVSVATASVAFAQATERSSLLTEAQAVEHVLKRPGLRDAIDGSVDVARADSIREGLWPNPQASYVREQTYGNGGTGEDYVWLSQSIDPSGSLGLRSRAAEQRATAAWEEGRARQAGIVASVRMRFYEVLRFQGQVNAAQHLIARLETAVDTVTRREAAGDASAYDRRRLERELANMQARLVTLEAGRDRAWASLAALVGDERDTSTPWPRVSGTLLPDSLPAENTLVQRLEARPDIRALENIAAAAEIEARAASRGWVPDLNLGAGWKSIDFGPNRIHGFLAMGAITLPFFDHSQDESLRAQGERRRARGERELALALARGEIRGLLVAARRLRETARRYRENRSESSAALVRTAEAGYHGGELGVLELLDAYRGAEEDEERALDLEFQARRARIELELSSGDYAP